MELNGIIKKVDDDGKILIPEDIRKCLKILPNTKLEFMVECNKIVLSKFSDIVAIKEYSDAVANAISATIDHDILISDNEKILSSSKKKYIDKELSEQVQELIYKKEIVIKKQADGSEMLSFFVNTTNEFSCQLIVPILKEENAVGSIIILATENKCFDDDSIKICKSFAKFLSDQITC